MGSLEKFSEAIAVVGHKKEAIENAMRLIMREWEGVEKNSRTIQDISARAVSELESKQKHSRELVESVQASYALLNSKKRWLEEGIEKLDGKVEFVRGVLKEVEVGKVQSSVMGDLIDKQLKELALKEKQIQHLSESLNLTPKDVEEKKNELHLMEKALNKRKDEMDSRQKQLEARELEACTEQQMLKKIQQEMDAEKKRLECELESRNASLVERESLIASKERTLVEKESEFALKQKIWDSELESRKASLVDRESVIVFKEMDVELKEKLLEKRENLLQSKVMSNARENIIHQPDYPQEICMDGNKRGFGDGSAGEVFVEDSLRRDGKRRCSGDGLTEHVKVPPHPKNSGSDGRLQTKTSDEVVVLNDSESNLEVRADMVLKDTQKRVLERHYNVGETWACYYAKDSMPGTYVKIIGVTELVGKVRIQVDWMKPFPRHAGENDWIMAGLPVGCGTFAPWRRSLEYPHILFQPMFCPAWNPCLIVPFKGETWAIYKDWDIKTWSSHPDIHRRCEYEIVEILPYSWGASSSGAVRVAYLDKLPVLRQGSTCSFQRRSKKEEDTCLIPPNSLYRFSHKVPSSINSDVFELDKNALPPGF